MQSDQIVTFVRTVPVFHFLEDEHLQELASQVQVREVPPNELLLRQGEEGSELFIVVQGEAAAIATEASVESRMMIGFSDGASLGTAFPALLREAINRFE